MINYKTVWTGPADRTWYRVRGLSVVETSTDPETNNISLLETITKVYCLGHIWWQNEKFPNLTGEIAVPAMLNTDWAQFSDWLHNITTSEVQTLEQFVELYEQTNTKITWDNYVEPEPVVIEPVYVDPGQVNIEAKQ